MLPVACNIPFGKIYIRECIVIQELMIGKLEIQSNQGANNKQAGEQLIKACSFGHNEVGLLKGCCKQQGFSKAACLAKPPVLK
jgi:hypothetical protein